MSTDGQGDEPASDGTCWWRSEDGATTCVSMISYVCLGTVIMSLTTLGEIKYLQSDKDRDQRSSIVVIGIELVGWIMWAASYVPVNYLASYIISRIYSWQVYKLTPLDDIENLSVA